MLDRRNFKKLLIAPFLILAFLSQSTQAQAWWGQREHHPRHHHPGGIVVLPVGFVSLVIGRSRYYYCDGSYYQRFEEEYVPVSAPIGAVVRIPPRGSRSLVINGVVYYTYNSVYYRPVRYGYEVVPAPRVVVVESAPVVSAPVPMESREKFGISDVITLSRSGTSDDAIIDKISRTGSVFNLSSEEVEALRNQGVSTRVVNFMLRNNR